MVEEAPQHGEPVPRHEPHRPVERPQLRYGVAVVTEAGLVVAVTANVLTVVGRGPWAALHDSPRMEAAVLQLFIAVAVLGAWLLAVEITERERARAVSRQEAAARRAEYKAVMTEVEAEFRAKGNYSGADMSAEANRRLAERSEVELPPP